VHRRQFLIKSAIAATATAVRWPNIARAEAGPTWPGFAAATVIDALGAPGGGSFGDRVPLTAANLADVTASGLTAVNVTVGGVGELPGI
jgi:membrane dipeptidase